MSYYTPVLTGEVSHLRSGIEGLLATSSSAIHDRISQLDVVTAQAGYRATFGAEVEFELVPDPTSSTIDEDSIYDNSAFYAILAHACGGEILDRSPPDHKGRVLRPSVCPSPILYSAPSVDGQAKRLWEARTAPADGNEAIERYWNLLNSIGVVANELGHMALVHSTHFNAAVWYKRTSLFVNFRLKHNAPILAAVQDNLVAINPLQLDAGLDTSLVALEAFPNVNDASTTVHRNRLEMRHATVGVIDPRPDVLATLSGLEQHVRDEVPAESLEHVHSCRDFNIYSGPFKLDVALGRKACWDMHTQKIALPTELSPGGSRPGTVDIIREAVEQITGVCIWDTGELWSEFRQLADSLGKEKKKVTVDADYKHAGRLSQLMQRAEIHFEGLHLLRVLPQRIFDSPDEHKKRRRRIKQVRPIQEMFGPALGALTQASRAITEREKVIDDHMVFVPDFGCEY